MRSDGKPIAIKQLSDPRDNSIFEIEFIDQVRGKTRLGRTAFVPPSIFTLRSSYVPSNGTNPQTLKLSLLVLVVPVTPGTSRVFLAAQPGVKLPLPFGLTIPQWLIHSFSNKFLDSDIWIHDQERFSRGIK